MPFDTRSFIKTLLIYVLLAAVLVTLGHLNENRKLNPLVLVGFPVILASSFYFGRKLKHFQAWLILTVITVAIFLFVTFVAGFLIEPTGYVIYALISSICIGVFMTLLLDMVYGVYRKYATMIVTMLCVLVAYAIMFNMETDFEDESLYIMAAFQVLMLLPLAAGLSLQRKEA